MMIFDFNGPWNISTSHGPLRFMDSSKIHESKMIQLNSSNVTYAYDIIYLLFNSDWAFLSSVMTCWSSSEFNSKWRVLVEPDGVPVWRNRLNIGSERSCRWLLETDNWNGNLYKLSTIRYNTVYHWELIFAFLYIPTV